MNPLQKQETVYNLILADVVIGKLPLGASRPYPSFHNWDVRCSYPWLQAQSNRRNVGNLYRLLVRIDVHRSVADWYIPLASENDGVVVCVLRPYNHSDGLYIQLMQLSLVIAREAEPAEESS